MKRLLSSVLCLLTCSLCYGSPLPKKSRPDRDAFLLPYIQANAICAEIGVATGSFSYHTLLQQSPKKLFLVDTWDYWPSTRESTEFMEQKQKTQDERYQQVLACFAPFNNVKVIRGRSTDVAKQFPKDYFDYVYIDAEHSFQAVLADLNAYFPKVKIGGYLMGDDYGWTGIKPGVQEFLAHHKDSCTFVKAAAGQYVLQRVK